VCPDYSAYRVFAGRAFALTPLDEDIVIRLHVLIADPKHETANVEWQVRIALTGLLDLDQLQLRAIDHVEPGWENTP